MASALFPDAPRVVEPSRPRICDAQAVQDVLVGRVQLHGALERDDGARHIALPHESDPELLKRGRRVVVDRESPAAQRHRGGVVSFLRGDHGQRGHRSHRRRGQFERPRERGLRLGNAALLEEGMTQVELRRRAPRRERHQTLVRGDRVVFREAAQLKAQSDRVLLETRHSRGGGSSRQ